ncbi:agmatine deiminase family protein [Balneolaceae bacterium ANBcel3]|nr:agmatine deiminase family protein [Balneolaceae bacterium ANBcel3]
MKKDYYMPPEWATHKSTLLAWPDNRETWPGERLNRAEHVFADILEALTPHEHVDVLVANEQAQQAAAALIQNRDVDWNKVRLIRMPVNDVWIRDYGPISVREKTDDGSRVVFLNWEYNAWGGKYPPYDSDNAIPENIGKLLDYPVVDTKVILEGGSIDVNGAGCVLTTESVLLNPNRNPDMNREQIEDVLRTYLGVQKVIWLKNGLKGDDTDGHIDDLARFVSEKEVFVAVSDDPSDPNYAVLKENWEILSEATDVHGRPFEIVEVPLPNTKIKGTTVDGSDHVPASYMNFYIANKCVLVPVYDERYDDKVLQLFQSVFPDRYIKGIDCRDLVWGQGSIHCVTQQVTL